MTDAHSNASAMPRTRRRPLLRVLLVLIACLPVLAAPQARAADPNKVLHLASPDIDTLDPQQYNDSPSFDVLRAIFEGLYEYDYLATPTHLSPLTATALPEITDGGRTWTMHVRPGIHFTDDPAFKGARRELVAADYVYAIERWLDPNLRRGGAPVTADLIVGMRAAVDAATRSGHFDYDRPIEGLRALDRYTLRLELVEPSYPVIRDTLTLGAVAREVVEDAHGDIRMRAVGTGPYRLREWRRGSRVVLEANPDYRTLTFPTSGDPAKAATVAAMRGRTLPQIGVIDIAIIDEDLTRLLEFGRGTLDYVVLRGEIANRLLDDRGRLKPEVAAQGIARHAFPEPFTFMFWMNMQDPVLGGLDKDRVALRRAIALGLDSATVAKVVYAGQALPANQLVPPSVLGHDAALPTRPLHDPAAAKALLDRFGYAAREGDGYRQRPGGKPLTITIMLRSGAVSRELQTLVKRNMDEIGLRVEFHVTPFQDAVKELEAGKYQMFFGGYGGQPTGYPQLATLYSKSSPTLNFSRFSLPEYDRAMQRFLRSPTDAESLAAARAMSDIARTYMPELPVIFRLENDYVQPWVLGFSPQRFDTYWKYMDIDLERKRQGLAK